MFFLFRFYFFLSIFSLLIKANVMVFTFCANCISLEYCFIYIKTLCYYNSIDISTITVLSTIGLLLESVVLDTVAELVCDTIVHRRGIDEDHLEKDNRMV